jgi:large subunit ribosomal protein L30
MTRLDIRQHRSAIGEKPGAKRTLSALGLGRTGKTVSHDDTPSLRGKLRRVAHLVTISDPDAAKVASKEEAR